MRTVLEQFFVMLAGVLVFFSIVFCFVAVACFPIALSIIHHTWWFLLCYLCYVIAVSVVLLYHISTQ